MNPKPLSKSEYVEQVLKLYTGLAETPSRYSRIDRQLAQDLYQKQIGFEEVEAALLLASSRRLLRRDDAPKLGPIRSLHYFLPVIEELRSMPGSAGYIEYLRHKFRALQDSGRLRLRKS